MSKTGIAGIASYIPGLRIRAADIGRFWGGGGSGEHAVCGSDEDVVTLAVAAGEKLLAESKTSPGDLDFICVATTSAPYAEQPISHVVALALGAREDVGVADHAGSPRAATTALLDCVGAVESGRARLGLVICTDARNAEPGSELEKTLGAGAVAMLVGQDNLMFGIESGVSSTDLFVDRWRQDGTRYVREYDPRFEKQYGFVAQVTRSVEKLLAKAGLAAGDVGGLAIAQPHRGFADCIKKLGFKPAQTAGSEIFSKYGDIGAASAFVSLLHLSGYKRGDRILLVNYGAGGADALVLTALRKPAERSDGAPGTYITYDDWLKVAQLVRKDYVVPPLSVPPNSAYLWRSRKEMLQLVGAKCDKCGTVNFPASIRRLCIKCGGQAFSEVALGRKGTVHTYCVNYYMPDGFDVPLPFIVADMEGGTRYGALGSAMDVGELKIGNRVQLALRKYSSERGISTYGYKFVSDV